MGLSLRDYRPTREFSVRAPEKPQEPRKILDAASLPHLQDAPKGLSLFERP